MLYSNVKHKGGLTMLPKCAKNIIPLGLFVFLFCFSLAYGGSNICEFDGWLTNNSTIWDEVEFSVLLEGKGAPGYFLMTSTIGEIFVTDKEILKSKSCKIHRYVENLIMFYDTHRDLIEKNDEEVGNMLAFIKNKIMGEENENSKE